MDENNNLVEKASVTGKTENKKTNDYSKELLNKDKEIEQLKKNLEEARKVNVAKKDDIRASVNSLGDVAKVCIGVVDGRRLWKKANELTDADIERRDTYIASIKQQNARKY